MAKFRASILRPSGSGKKKKKLGSVKKKGAVAYRKAVGSPEPLRAARMLAGY